MPRRRSTPRALRGAGYSGLRRPTRRALAVECLRDSFAWATEGSSQAMGALVLLACDECGHYFHQGKRSAERLRPDDFAQARGAMGDVEDLIPAAVAARWHSAARPEGGTTWCCAECLAKRLRRS